jgi:hypothetical protein
VEIFRGFILVDDKGNEFFKQLGSNAAFCAPRGPYSQPWRPSCAA